ncbi:MAG: flavodoxin [Bacteroidales bacterium]
MMKENKVLIAYFSWSGNTREIANRIHKMVGGDMFEIQRADDYPTNYNAVLDIAKKEIRSESKPELKDKLAEIEKYNTIFIGYPNWWNTFPAPVTTFLSEHNFSKKTIIPFCTHGGGGIGRSISDMAKLCPEAIILNELSINGSAANSSSPAVEKWLNKVLNASIR